LQSSVSQKEAKVSAQQILHRLGISSSSSGAKKRTASHSGIAQVDKEDMVVEIQRLRRKRKLLNKEMREYEESVETLDEHIYKQKSHLSTLDRLLSTSSSSSTTSSSSSSSLSTTNARHTHNNETNTAEQHTTDHRGERRGRIPTASEILMEAQSRLTDLQIEHTDLVSEKKKLEVRLKEVSDAITTDRRSSLPLHGLYDPKKETGTDREEDTTDSLPHGKREVERERVAIITHVQHARRELEEEIDRWKKELSRTRSLFAKQSEKALSDIEKVVLAEKEKREMLTRAKKEFWLEEDELEATIREQEMIQVQIAVLRQLSS